MRRLIPAVLIALAVGGCSKFNSDEMTATLERTISAKAAPRYAADRWKTMQAVYRERAYAPIWLDREKPRQQARDLIDALTSADNQGLRMKDYDLPGLKTVDHVCVLGAEKAAWFKDPDGNVLCLHERLDA